MADMTSVQRPTWPGVVALCLAGIVLGAAYNWLGLRGEGGWGLTWVATDRFKEFSESSPVVAASPSDSSSNSYVTDRSDPLAIAGPEEAAADLPEIPEAGRPVQIELGALEQYVDARAAFVIDAREAFEYADGHIPGAVSLPFDEVATDTARLEALDTGGRPIVVYCGGGTCELSMNMAYELFYAGHRRVAVYMGGYPEWVEAGKPIETGAAP